MKSSTPLEVIKIFPITRLGALLLTLLSMQLLLTLALLTFTDVIT